MVGRLKIGSVANQIVAPRSQGTASRARRRDQLSPLDSALPGALLLSKQFAPVTPFPSTLAILLNLYHSKDFKASSFDTLARQSLVTPLECILTKIPGGRGTPLSLYLLNSLSPDLLISSCSHGSRITGHVP